MTISEQVENFKNERVSNKILLFLFNAVEMLGTLKCKTNSCNCMDIVSEMMLIRELRYSYALVGKDLNYSDIIYDVFSVTKSNEFTDNYYCVKKCVEFADEITTTVKMLPATDFLRINYQIGVPQQDFLHYESFAAVLEKGSKVTWEAVAGLCNCQPYLHELLEMALAAYWLEDLSRFNKIDIIARNILLSSYLKKQEKVSRGVIFLNKLYLLYDDFITLANSGMISEYITFFLDKVTDSLKELYIFIENVEELIYLNDIKMKAKLPKLYSEELNKTLYGSTGMKYTDLSTKLNVTPKTAQEYLKKFEQIGVLQSKKIGKERIFVNSGLVRIFEEEE